MLIKGLNKWLLGICMGSMCLSFTSGFASYLSSRSTTPPPNPKDERTYQANKKYSASGREQVAYMDPAEEAIIRNQPYRNTDWDNQESWRYQREGFYQGKSQAQVYRENHPYGYGGIGYDGDPEYLKMQELQHEYYQNKSQNTPSDYSKTVSPKNYHQQNHTASARQYRNYHDTDNNGNGYYSESSIATDRQNQRAYNTSRQALR